MTDAETVRVKIVCEFCHGAKEPDGQPVDCEACHEFGWDFATLAEPDASLLRLGRAEVRFRRARAAVNESVNDFIARGQSVDSWMASVERHTLEREVDEARDGLQVSVAAALAALGRAKMIMGKRAYRELPLIQREPVTPGRTNIVPQPGVKYRGDAFGMPAVLWLNEKGGLSWESVSFRQQDAPEPR